MTPSSFARRAALGLLAFLAVSMPSWAQVTLNLKDADISTLIATVSEVTGKNFIVDPRVKGKVTVVSSSPMDSAGVYETFLAVLQVQGFAAIPAGEAIKIVPETNARWDGGGLNASGAGLPIDEVVTHVYNIQNVSAAQLVPILRPLVPQWGHLAAYAPSNMLIISDRAANVVRLEKLIRQIDTSSDREIDMVQLKYAGAAEVVRTLTALTQGNKNAADASTAPAVVLADERSNSVLVGGDKSDRQKMLDIIRRLDIQVGEDGATQVVYLRYASAENLAPILEGYAQQAAQGDRNGAQGAAAATPTAASSGANANGIKVLADKDTNALIITAPPKAMRMVRDVVAQLDIRRRQVLVDGIVAEVSADKSSQLGVDWAVYNGDKIAAAGILNPNTLTSIAGAAQASSTAEAIAKCRWPGRDARRRQDRHRRRHQLRPVAQGAEGRRQHQRALAALAADARQRRSRVLGRPGSALPDRLVQQHRHDEQLRPGQPVPDRRAQGRRPQARHHPADQRRRLGEAQAQARNLQPGLHRHLGRRSRHQQAHAQQHGDGRRRPDSGARRP